MLSLPKTVFELSQHFFKSYPTDCADRLGVFKSIVPSGASKGDYEAIEIRDADNSKFDGMGVLKAVENVKSILGPKLLEQGFKLPGDVEDIDRFMVEFDGSKDKARLGANAILGISMALWRAAAACKVCLLGYNFIRVHA